MATSSPTFGVETEAVVRARIAARNGLGRYLRTLGGLTQADVAAECGVTEACVGHWEAGRRQPRRAHALKYGVLLASIERAAGPPESGAA